MLAVLPFSFDYGFSQLTTAFLVGASVSLIDHLFARDVVTAVQKDRITGLAAVPPLWIQLADLQWPAGIDEHLRYITNSGGRMPRATLDKLRASLPRTRPFLMYGLTEAFRGTYLPPEEIDRRPDSMGKAIPNAEIMVVRPDGTPCDPDEPGELVQRGALVGLGYWNDPAKTAERFRPVPAQRTELPLTEMAVWSGDTVRCDADGYLYFVGRRDEMIKTSGYRVSPTEVEEVVYASGLVGDAVAVAAPHPGAWRRHRTDCLTARLRRRGGWRGASARALPGADANVHGAASHCVAHGLAAEPERQIRSPRARRERARLLWRPGMTLDAFSQHPSLPWYVGAGRRARRRRKAHLRDCGRGRTHAVLCLRSLGDDTQGRDAPRGAAAVSGAPLRDQGESVAQHRQPSRGPGRWSRCRVRRGTYRRARHGRAAHRDQFRRAGQDHGGARACRRRRHRHQHGVAARDAAARAISHCAAARAPRLPCASIPISSSSRPE